MSIETNLRTINDFSNITTATTTTVKSGSGQLKKVILNGSPTGTVTIYDNTAASGTLIATIPASATMGTWEFDCKFDTGLTVVTSAADDITVIYA